MTLRTRSAARPDALTLLGYAQLAAWAWFLYGFGAMLPLLRAEQGTSRTVLGLHSLALAAGGVLAGVIAVPVVRRLRRRGTFPVGAGLVTAGVAALVAGGAHPAVTLPACLVAGVGGSLCLQSTISALVQHHGPAGPAVVSEGNAVAAVVGLVSPLAVGLGVRLGVTWRPAALVVVPLLALVVLAARRVPAGTPALDDPLPPVPATGQVPLPAAFWVLVVLVMACVGVEFCCTAWSADLLRQRTGMGPGPASAGVSAVVGGMALGRFTVGRLARRRSPRRLLLVILLVTLAGWAVTWTATSPVPALAGLTLLGAGISGQYPLGASLAMAAADHRMDAASGRLSVCVAASSGVVPFALGAAADATSTHAAFVAVPMLVVVAVGALALAVRSARGARGARAVAAASPAQAVAPDGSGRPTDPASTSSTDERR